MQTTILKIGTRESELALAQAKEVRASLMAAHGVPEEVIAIVPITTTGDKIQDRPLSEVGGKGLFTKELEDALLDGRVDIAVHSSKDVQTVLPETLYLSAFLPREDVRDCFVGRDGARLADLPRGASVGTSSLRRQALVRRLRPDLKVVDFRGNIQTRLRKLEEGVVAGTFLANAGIRRLKLKNVTRELMPVDLFPPAPGQGAICIESRVKDIVTDALIAPLRHKPTALAVTCERGFLAALDGSCRMPIAGHATVEEDRITFRGMILSADGSKAHEIRGEGGVDEAEAIGRRAGEEIRAMAGPGFFEAWK